MNDIRLKSLTLQNFRSFQSPQTVTFAERGLVMLRGRSGHGKSNLALGISYALDYCPKAGTALKTWDCADSWGAKLELSTQHGGLVVEQGSKFKLSLAGEAIGGSAASKRMKISETVGLEPSLLGALTYRPQRTFGLFLSMADDEKKEFLARLLGLDVFENQAEQAEARFPTLTDAANAAADLVARDRLFLEYLQGQVSSLEDEGPALTAECAAKEASAALEAKHLEQRTKFQDLQKQVVSASETAFQSKMQVAVELEKRWKAVVAARVPPPKNEETEAERTKLVGQIEKLRSVHGQLVVEQDTAKTKWHERRRSLEVELAKNQPIAGRLGDLRVEHTKLKDKIQHLQSETCPTCNQKWAAGASKVAYLNRLQSDLIKNEEAQEASIAAAEKLTQLNAMVAAVEGDKPKDNPKIEQAAALLLSLEQRLAVLSSENSAKVAAYQAECKAEEYEFKAQIAEAQAQAKAARREILENQELVEAQAAVTAADMAWRQAHTHLADCRLALRLIQGRNAVVRANADKVQAEIAKTVDRLKTNEVALALATAAVDQERDFAGVVRSYLGAIVQEVLGEISSEANEVLSRVPNVQHIVLEFKTETETKAGKKRSKITPIVRVNGAERPFSDLSGGQTSVVELATDIAIRRVVSNRRQVHIGWMILDEAFDGLGKQDKESVLEVLQHAAQDDLIVVIDHSTEFKDHFDQYVTVEMVDGESRIR